MACSGFVFIGRYGLRPHGSRCLNTVFGMHAPLLLLLGMHSKGSALLPPPPSVLLLVLLPLLCAAGGAIMRIHIWSLVLEWI